MCVCVLLCNYIDLGNGLDSPGILKWQKMSARDSFEQIYVSCFFFCKNQLSSIVFPSQAGAWMQSSQITV